MLRRIDTLRFVVILVVALFAVGALVSCSNSGGVDETATDGDTNYYQTDGDTGSDNNGNNQTSTMTAKLVNIKKIASADYIAGVLSPDGKKVALTKYGFKGLYILDLRTWEIKPVVEEERAGYRPVWSEDSEKIAYRVPGQTGYELPLMAVDLDGNEVAPFLSVGSQWAKAENDQIYFIQHKNVVAITNVNSHDKFYSPMISPAGDLVVYSGITSGIHVYNPSTGESVSLGYGTNPSFDPEGRYLVFERAQDDAHDLTASELYIVDMEDPNLTPVQLTNTPDVIEIYPSIAANKVVYSAQDGIYIGNLVITK